MKSLKFLTPFLTGFAAGLLFTSSLTAQQMEHQDNVIVAPGEEKTAGFAAKNPGITFQLDVKPGGGHKFQTGGDTGILGENRDSTFWQRTVDTESLKTYKVLVNRIDDGHEAVFKMQFKKPEASGGGGGGSRSLPPPAYVKAVNCFVKIHKPGTIAAPGTLISTPSVAGKPYYGIMLTNTDDEINTGIEDHTTATKTGDGLTKDDDLVKVELSWNPTTLKPHMVEGKELRLFLPTDTKAYLANGDALTDMTVTIGSAASGQLATLGGTARKQNIFIEGTAAWATGGGSREIVLKVNGLDYAGAEAKALLLPIILNNVGFTNGHDIASDDLSTDYVSPQWQDLDGDRTPNDVAGGEHNYSIAYTRNTKPTISAVLTVPGLPTGVTASISAIGTNGVSIASESSSTSGSTVTLNPKVASKAFPDKVRFYDRSIPSDPTNPASPASTEKGFKLDWKITFSDIGEIPAGSTSHQAYITLGDPIATFNDQTGTPVTRIQKQEVFFYLGCKGADTKNSATDVWNGIWDEISDRVVQRIDKDTGDPSLDDPNADGGTGMIYWRTGAIPIPRDLNDMLTQGHATCGTWSVFMLACANTQSLTSHEFVRVTAPQPLDYAKMATDYRSHYSVPAGNTIAHAKYMGGAIPYPLTPADGDHFLLVVSDNNYSTHGIFLVNSVSMTGNFIDVPANRAGFPSPSSSPSQGNSNAKAWFGNHAIVKHDGKYYDPSYGGPHFTGKVEWENGSLQDFGALIVSFAYDAATPQWVENSLLIWKERANPSGGPECDIKP